jgi:hypothetical protein
MSDKPGGYVGQAVLEGTVQFNRGIGYEKAGELRSRSFRFPRHRQSSRTTTKDEDDWRLVHANSNPHNRRDHRLTRGALMFSAARNEDGRVIRNRGNHRSSRGSSVAFIIDVCI